MKENEARPCSFQTSMHQREGHPTCLDLHSGHAEVAFIFICEPICATDQVRCPGAVWKLGHVLTDGLWKTEVVGGFRGSGHGPRDSSWNMKPATQDSIMCLLVCVHMAGCI